jgi:hypothetical protein
MNQVQGANHSAAMGSRFRGNDESDGGRNVNDP